MNPRDKAYYAALGALVAGALVFLWRLDQRDRELADETRLVLTRIRMGTENDHG